VHDAEVLACANELIAKGQFSPPRGGAVDISFPFVFAATP
jgi:hypothetical protein